METLTIRVQPSTKESLQGEADEHNLSLSEHVRDLISKGREYDETVAELENRIEEEAGVGDLRDRVDELEAERDELREQRDEARREVSRLEGRLEGITARLDEKDERIDYLEGEIQVKNARLDEADNRATALAKRGDLEAAGSSGLLGGLRRRLFGGSDGDNND